MRLDSSNNNECLYFLDMIRNNEIIYNMYDGEK